MTARLCCNIGRNSEFLLISTRRLCKIKSNFIKNKNLTISPIYISRTGYVQNSDNDAYKIV